MATKVQSQPAPEKFGVYCLANDEAFEWFQGFVRSLRKHDPDLPLTVIPYNSAITRLRALQAQFNFTVMDEATASRFDAIAPRVAGLKIAGGTFRKLCTFFGGYETFIFLDSDIVVTQKLEPLLRAFEVAAADFVYFDTDLPMVYVPDFARQMVAEYGSPGFNSGAFISRRGSITGAEILAAVDLGEKIRERFAIWGEQPFLNYLLDVTRRRRLPASALVPGISEKPWARVAFRHDAARDEYLDGAGRPMPFIHWPGCEWPTMFRPEVFLRHRTLGMGGVERLGYRFNFYYRRWRANLKTTLRKCPWFAGWVARREAQLQEQRRTAAAAK